MENMNPAAIAAATGLINGLIDWLKKRAEGSVYKRFFEKANTMFVVANSSGEFTKVNQAFAAGLGYSKEYLTKIKFMRLIHPDDVHKTIDAMDALREGAEVKGFKNRYLCGNGQYRTIEWIAVGNGEIHAVARFVD